MTQSLQINFNLGAVVSSCLVGLFISFLSINKTYQGVAYAGSFAGMSSLNLLGQVDKIFITSIIGCFIFLLLEKHFNGLGGRLGAFAFLSVVILTTISSILWKL